MQNDTNTQSICGLHNFRQQRERLSPFNLWFDSDFSRSLTSRSGSKDTNIQESDYWQRSSVRFSIVWRKGCSEFALCQTVSIWRIIKVSYTNKWTPMPEQEHSTFSCWWIVECFIEPVSWCNLIVHTWSTISIFPLGRTKQTKSFMTWGSRRDFAINSKGILKVPHCHWEVWSNLFW